MKLCLFSISYAGLWGQDVLPLPGVIAKAAELGYDGVMLAGKRPHLSVLDYSADKTAELRDLLQQHDLACLVIGAYTDFSHYVSELPSVELQIGYVEQLAKLAQQLDCRIVRVFTAYDRGAESPLATWTRLVGVFQEMCDRCGEHGVSVAVQNHHDLCLETPGLLEFLSDINRENCQLGFDAWSPALRGEDLAVAAKMAAPHTAITTNADYVRFARYRYQPDLVNYARAEVDMVRAVPFGEGFIDYQAFFTGLTSGGFDGVATYEMCSPLRGGGGLSNLDRCAKAYLNWMGRHDH
ncbi:MAG: sugar phosphate isomerase/epimerase family protein [Pirellulaceae bacterium]|nr:sugar phosphate isomerase/epimerase family protein [Pirellulaceae bacterium]